jgi:hydrogenase/urease accessory protein HupE
MSLMLAILVAVSIIAIVPSIAEAHLVTTGLGPFYDGAMHLLLSPGDLLGLVAAVLLAGLCGPKAGRWIVIALPLAWLIAGLIGLNLPVGVDLPWLSVVSLVILGGLVAVNPAMTPAVVAAMAASFGALHGLLNGSALAAIGAGPLSIAGIATTVLVIGLLCSAGVVSLKAAWTRVAVRVAGSWIAAVGMLMFGWIFRGAG